MTVFCNEPKENNYEMTVQDFEDAEEPHELKVVGWTDENGNFHKGDPKKP